ncbi:protein transport protein Sec61 subunit gamma-like [Lethenteron reissneri]|uniref:protein transport protein Sec61 subunit gamma-like n=1 Tax=Lethenteron reissneri TaxID=7753 RepID=UPI002AB6E2B3|nr:protein transport protein Sec61 subunit gamma-like [Lethenteron reissneri]XP_061435145.1 protein transport protein Sec61 subunit gamma-like [Lethenteron reissneri]
MDQAMTFVEPGRQFAKDSIRLVKRCTKQFQKIAIATAIGFAIMGFIGFFVKLIQIPINDIIIGSSDQQEFYFKRDAVTSGVNFISSTVKCHNVAKCVQCFTSRF